MRRYFFNKFKDTNNFFFYLLLFSKRTREIFNDFFLFFFHILYFSSNLSSSNKIINYWEKNLVLSNLFWISLDSCVCWIVCIIFLDLFRQYSTKSIIFRLCFLLDWIFFLNKIISNLIILIQAFTHYL
jgi:hypothetical protein